MSAVAVAAIYFLIASLLRREPTMEADARAATKFLLVSPFIGRPTSTAIFAAAGPSITGPDYEAMWPGCQEWDARSPAGPGVPIAY